LFELLVLIELIIKNIYFEVIAIVIN